MIFIKIKDFLKDIIKFSLRVCFFHKIIKFVKSFEDLSTKWLYSEMPSAANSHIWKKSTKFLRVFANWSMWICSRRFSKLRQKKNWVFLYSFRNRFFICLHAHAPLAHVKNMRFSAGGSRFRIYNENTVNSHVNRRWQHDFTVHRPQKISGHLGHRICKYFVLRFFHMCSMARIENYENPSCYVRISISGMRPPAPPLLAEYRLSLVLSIAPRCLRDLIDRTIL